MRRTVLSITLSAAFMGTALAQAPAPEREKPKLKDFGSSLNRLKWDPEKSALVESIPKKKMTTDEEDVVRVDTDLVVGEVLVLDKEWRPVQGLTRDDFVITEDGVPQATGAFSLGDDARIPRSIVLIIDYSGSQFPYIQTSVKAAKTLVDKLNPSDTMAIVTDDVELLVDFTRDKTLLKAKLDSLERKAMSGETPSEKKFGRSAQYSALMATLKEAFDNEDQRPIIIFQTDGDELGLLRNSPVAFPDPPNVAKDTKRLKRSQLIQKYREQNVREFSIDDVYKAAENSRATIYSIIPGYRLIGLSPEKQRETFQANLERLRQAWHFKSNANARMNESLKRMPAEVMNALVERATREQSTLAGVAKITGGWHDFLEDPSQSDRIYSLIFSDINRRYMVGYYPTNKVRDGKRRKLHVEVRGHPEYVVWGRKSYYAPGPEE
jgi:VWFA-related protein